MEPNHPIDTSLPSLEQAVRRATEAVSQTAPSTGDGSSRNTQGRERLGQVLLNMGFISQDQLEAALAIQRQKPFLRVGEILYGLQFITFAQIEQVLEEQYRDMRLGQLLVRRGLLQHDQLDEAIREHEATGLLLGHLVIRLGFCTIEQVTKVLEEQRVLQTYHG